VRYDQQRKFERFVDQMYNELLVNEPKGDFTGHTASTGLEEIAQHFNKLREAVKSGDKDRIRELAADVAVCALITACGADALESDVAVRSAAPVFRDDCCCSP